jgi:hypothetical protein
MKSTYSFIVTACLVVASLILLTTAKADAQSNYFQSFCASCHNNDTATCNGCHAHGVWQDSSRTVKNLTATTDLDLYQPGQTVTVTFSGGYRTGWIRAILYDHNGAEIDRVTGPTGMGDDGSGSPAQRFPVLLSAAAPTTPGFYRWTAAWFGSPFDISNPNVYPHVEERVQTNQFQVFTPPTSALTRINLISPMRQAVLSAPPTFTWVADGGTRNSFAVDASLTPNFAKTWSTRENLGLTISGTSWTMSQDVWNRIPAGSRVFWRVRGADLDAPTVTIIRSDETFSFFK